MWWGKKLVKLAGGSVVISPLVRAEFACLLARKCRAKEMDETDARRTMSALDRHLSTGSIRMVSISSRDFEQASEWIMAMKHPLRAPDAVHLAVAVRQGAVLWTLDRELSRAAKWIGLKTQK